MKSININQLQAQISAVMKDVEGGEVYEVMRYSRPVAVIRPKKDENQSSRVRCDECISKLDEVLNSLQK